MAVGLGGARVVRSGGVPYYVQVADTLRSDIAADRWSAGELLPSEAVLCDMFLVSRTAVRQALAQLVSEGLLHKERGRGTFVTRPQVSLAVQEIRGFYDEMAGQGKPVVTDVIRQEQAVVPPAMAADLAVPMGSRVVCLERVRTVGDEQLVHVVTYLPLPRFKALLEADLTAISLYAVLEEQFGVRASAGRRRVEAVKAADAVARLLHLPKNSPALRVSAVNLDATGKPFEAFEAHYRADRTSFEFVIGTNA